MVKYLLTYFQKSIDEKTFPSKDVFVHVKQLLEINKHLSVHCKVEKALYNKLNGVK